MGKYFTRDGKPQKVSNHFSALKVLKSNQAPAQQEVIEEKIKLTPDLIFSDENPPPVVGELLEENTPLEVVASQESAPDVVEVVPPVAEEVELVEEIIPLSEDLEDKEEAIKEDQPQKPRKYKKHKKNK